MSLLLRAPSQDSGADPDDPLALPFPADTVLLTDWSGCAENPPAAPVDLAVRALQQQQQELGLDLPLQPLASGAKHSDQLPGEQQPDLLLELAGFRVQMVCGPFWSDELRLSPGPWQGGRPSPHLVLGAWVEGASGAIRFAGVLTAAEVLAAIPTLPQASGLQTLAWANLRGGVDRLFSLVRLMNPAALDLPQAAENPAEPLPILQWLEGHLGAALAPFAPQWLPVEAAAFRSSLAAPGTAVLVAVAIPLVLVAGRVCWGRQRGAGSERFQLLLSICGQAGQAEQLEVRLEPSLQGDLLPQNLTLVVGEQRRETGAEGNQGPLVLHAPAGEEWIAIRLERQGVTQLELPPMILPS